MGLGLGLGLHLGVGVGQARLARGAQSLVQLTWLGFVLDLGFGFGFGFGLGFGSGPGSGSGDLLVVVTQLVVVLLEPALYAVHDVSCEVAHHEGLPLAQPPPARRRLAARLGSAEDLALSVRVVQLRSEGLVRRLGRLVRVRVGVGVGVGVRVGVG